MKLLVFFPSIGYGGCEEYAMGIAKHISKSNWTVEVCFPELTETKMITEYFKEYGILIHHWDMEREYIEWGDWAEQKAKAIELFHNIKPDRVLIVLPAPDSALGFIAACAELKISGLVVFQLANEVIKIPEQHMAYCEKSLRFGLKYIATSKYMLPFITATFPFLENEMEIIPNGRIFNATEPNANNGFMIRNHLRDQLSISRDAKIILTLARLTPQKGHQDIITIAHELIRRFPEIYFIWAGEGEDVELLTHIIRGEKLEKRILLIGHRNNVQELLLGSDLFLLPSHWESTPLSITEAMFYNCPVIVSNAGGNGELVSDKKTGFVFEAKNCDNLLQTLSTVLRNPESVTEILVPARNAAFERTEFMKNRVLELLNEAKVC